MSTIIGLVSTFRLPLHWCVGLDFSSPVSASNVQSAASTHVFVVYEYFINYCLTLMLEYFIFLL